MKSQFSYQIPKSEGNNITAKEMIEVVKIMDFIDFAESVSWQVFAQVKGVVN